MCHSFKSRDVTCATIHLVRSLGVISQYVSIIESLAQCALNYFNAHPMSSKRSMGNNRHIKASNVAYRVTCVVNDAKCSLGLILPSNVSKVLQLSVEVAASVVGRDLTAVEVADPVAVILLIVDVSVSSVSVSCSYQPDKSSKVFDYVIAHCFAVVGSSRSKPRSKSQVGAEPYP
ncbi:hypothetical protein BHE74_00045932 [Ensete ventricosum]|nr:hypothetical protein BHE74_00045932 [Ensete ventricosum]